MDAPQYAAKNTRRLCLVTAGPTREYLDPVRFVSNPSSGKMGYAVAAAAVAAGWPTCLISGPTALPVPAGLEEWVPVVSAAEMHAAVEARFPHCRLLVMTAAVSDMRPRHCRPHKVRKSDLEWRVEFEPTVDILHAMGQCKQPGQWLAGFAAETQDPEAGALAKLKAKNLDWIAANRVAGDENAFAADTNRIILYDRWGGVEDPGHASKTELATRLMQRFTRMATD